MPITPTPKIWMNGELVDWDKAQVHVLTHTLHYGTGVFEGIRAYETADGPAVFRLTEHIERLFSSAQILGMEIPYTVEELVAATKQTVASTGLDSCYIRPIAYFGYGEMGLNTLPCSVDVSIACWPWGAYLGDDAVEKGVRMKISSWTRHDHNTMPPASKTTGNYVNSSLAKVEALKAGYDEAIMLAPNGLVAECTGENIFVARHGKLLTPPLSAGALEGITQNTVTTIAADLGFDVVVDNIARSDLYIAEEAFVCGTAAEVSSINSVDDRKIPCPGPMTSRSPRSTTRPSAARTPATPTGANTPAERSGPIHVRPSIPAQRASPEKPRVRCAERNASAPFRVLRGVTDEEVVVGYGPPGGDERRDVLRSVAAGAVRGRGCRRARGGGRRSALGDRGLLLHRRDQPRGDCVGEDREADGRDRDPAGCGTQSGGHSDGDRHARAARAGSAARWYRPRRPGVDGADGGAHPVTAHHPRRGDHDRASTPPR